MDGNPEPERPGGVCPPESRQTEEESEERLRRIREGDADAFEALAREHAPRLFRFALRLAGRREDAEDLVQETLVRSLPALKKFEGRAQLSTYLIRALGNIWKNRLRSKKRSRIVDWFQGRATDEDDDQAQAPTAIDSSPSALERLEAEDRATEVHEALARLEPTRRWTLLLREVEELSYEEIASMTGVPVGTVRSRLARARDDMRKLLGARS